MRSARRVVIATPNSSFGIVSAVARQALSDSCHAPLRVLPVDLADRDEFPCCCAQAARVHTGGIVHRRLAPRHATPVVELRPGSWRCQRPVSDGASAAPPGFFLFPRQHLCGSTPLVRAGHPWRVDRLGQYRRQLPIVESSRSLEVVGASLPIIMEIPSALHSSSARSMIGRCPFRRARNAFPGSRASLAASSSVKFCRSSSASMTRFSRSVVERFTFRFFGITSWLLSIPSPTGCRCCVLQSSCRRAPTRGCFAFVSCMALSREAILRTTNGSRAPLLPVLVPPVRWWLFLLISEGCRCLMCESCWGWSAVSLSV